MERQLSQESDWKQIQKNTFTRWINEHLKTVKKHIESLESDLSDGLNLIALVEVLSGKQLPRRNEKPIVRVQKLENVNIAINFLTNEEGIKLVNIGKFLQLLLFHAKLNAAFFAPFEFKKSCIIQLHYDDD
ncbi:filamin-A-like protein [Dinothrombium tinctorium]|uniref:Filamin-A-like protein n=1 Tax=Dinothrombium tinctorium TaxID=1965070 RepID=A0A3S3QD89_9ACAR|nr:filamin-A-like protein [Dinothrombium tinctorium]RWS17908.1 filamin-A-like protein [Dinothrombium tinctorium]RWS18018.1 filamin-A-like protein [Dinothrombium tinctorium]